MAFGNLRTFRWANGTQAHPVPLTRSEFEGLVALARENGVTKDVSGYIHPVAAITSWQQYLVSQAFPQLQLVGATVNAVEYNVNLASATVNEGGRVKINTYMLELAALKFRVAGHQIVRDNAITDEEIHGRIHIDTANGYVTVDAARENSTWTDTVTIEVLPVYEEWDDVRYTPKTLLLQVSAVKVTGATITVPGAVKPGGLFDARVSMVPSGHTKGFAASEAEAGNGLYLVWGNDFLQMAYGSDGSGIFLAPNVEGSYSMGCDVYAFGMNNLLADPSGSIQVVHPYIRFSITTDGTLADITAADPKVTLQRRDGQDAAVGEPVELTGTVDGSALVFTYGNGNVRGDGTETYSVHIDAVGGYNVEYADRITPAAVVNAYSAQYVAIPPNVYLLYSDGTLQSYDDLVEASWHTLAGKTPVAIQIYTAEATVIFSGEACAERKMYNSAGNGQASTLSDSQDLYNGIPNTKQLMAIYTNKGMDDPDEYAVAYVQTQSVTVGSKILQAYIGSIKESALIYHNRAKVTAMRSGIWNSEPILNSGSNSNGLQYSCSTKHSSVSNPMSLSTSLGVRSTSTDQKVNVILFYGDYTL